MKTFFFITWMFGIWAGLVAQIPPFFVKVDFHGFQNGAAAIVPVTDSTYILLGSGQHINDSIPRGIDMAGMDETGAVLWQNSVGRKGRAWYQGLWGNIIPTFDGNYVLGGYSIDSSLYYDNLIIKFTPEGDTLWTKTYRQSGSSSLYDVVQTPDSGLAFSGYLRFPEQLGRDDYLLLKTDADGNLLWQQQVQPSQPDWEWEGELPKLPAGLYLASLQQGGQLLGRRKVVVE